MNRANFRISCRNRLSVIAAMVVSCAYPCAGLALGTDEQRAACTPDVFRLCGSEIPDVSRITACMMQKRASLSTGCRAVMDRDLAAQSGKVASK